MERQIRSGQQPFIANIIRAPRSAFARNPITTGGGSGHHWGRIERGPDCLNATCTRRHRRARPVGARPRDAS